MKVKQTSIKTNLMYQSFYEILGIILPLLTSPYISRVLGAEGLGIFSYTYSIAYYFQLFGMLGVKFYGNRSIAQVRDSQDKVNIIYSEIFIIHIIFSVISTICYGIYSIMISQYKWYSILQLVMVFATVFDISWLFFGLEQFKVTVSRNTVIKLLSVIAIFVFVKDKDDLWKYILIMASSQFLGNIMLLWMSRKYVHFQFSCNLELKKHIKPLFVLFVPVISTSLFKYMDKIMLGMIGKKIELGYYENAEKILNVPLSIILSFGSVMLPKISNLLSNGKTKVVNKYIEMSIKYMSCISIAMAFGMAGLAINFAPVFWGNEFKESGFLIMLLAISLPFTTIANIVRNQDLIPNGKDSYYSIAIIIGAITNLIINWNLIPRLQSIGVTIGTIASEIIVCCVQMVMVDRSVNYRKYLKESTIFLIPGFTMFVCVYGIGKILGASIVSLLIQIIVGLLIYTGVVGIYFMITQDEEYLRIKKMIVAIFKSR